jgi:hypothetical protein
MFLAGRMARTGMPWSAQDTSPAAHATRMATQKDIEE